MRISRQAARRSLVAEQIKTILRRAAGKENYTKIASDYPGLSASCISVICLENGLRAKTYNRKKSQPAPVTHKVPTLGARIRINKENTANLESQLLVLRSEAEKLNNELNDALEA